MRQLGLFTSAQLAVMRDRTASRSYSPAGDEFRRRHQRQRAWGLTQRHAERLRQVRARRAASGEDVRVHAPAVARPGVERADERSAPGRGGRSADVKHVGDGVGGGGAVDRAHAGARSDGARAAGEAGRVGRSHGERLGGARCGGVAVDGEAGKVGRSRAEGLGGERANDGFAGVRPAGVACTTSASGAGKRAVSEPAAVAGRSSCPAGRGHAGVQQEDVARSTLDAHGGGGPAGVQAVGPARPGVNAARRRAGVRPFGASRRAAKPTGGERVAGECTSHDRVAVLSAGVQQTAAKSAVVWLFGRGPPEE